MTAMVMMMILMMLTAKSSRLEASRNEYIEAAFYRGGIDRVKRSSFIRPAPPRLLL